MKSISSDSFDSHIHSYINLKLKSQQIVLDYLSKSAESNDESYQIMVQTINNAKFAQNKNDMIEFLHFLVKISNNYHRYPLLLNKIEKILTLIKEDMKKLLTETKIFDIFKSNKKLLLLLFEEKIISPNQTIANTLTNKKYKKMNYLSYFYPEMKPFIPEKRKKQKYSYGSKPPIDFGQQYNQNKENFETNRRIGENEDYICHLIRNDSVIDFITHFTKNSLSLKQNIQSSIFETNRFLINKSPTLIEYATFFGSIQIFKYLYQNGVELIPSLWIYAIHGNNPEIIHFLEENHIKPNENDEYTECYKEAIKCHHNDIAEYINNTYLQLNQKKDKIEDNQKENTRIIVQNDADEPNWYDDYEEEEEKKEKEKTEPNWYDIKDEEENENNEIVYNETNDNPYHLFLKYHNYAYFDINMINDCSIYDICKYDYPSLFSILFQFSKIKNDDMKPLFISVKKRNNEIAQLILTNKDIDYNQKTQIVTKKIYEIESGYSDSYDRLFELKKENNTLLFTAAENENIEIFKIILENPNINVNEISITNIWSRKGYVEKINSYEYFNTINWWENKVYIRDDDIDEFRKEFVIKNTALQVSIEKKNLEMVKLLLSYHGIDANLKTIEKMWEYDHTENRRYGYERAEIKDNFPLKTAIMNENIEIFQLLLSHSGININEKSLTKKVKMNTEKHIWKNFYIKEKEDNLLSIAIEYCNSPALNLLISQPNIIKETKVKRRKRSIDYETENSLEDYYQIHYWRIEKRVKDIKNDYLYELRSKEDEDYYNTDEEEYEEDLFLMALMKDNIENLKIISSIPEVDISAKLKNGKTALHIAVENQYPNIVEFLLSTNKIDINAKTTGNDKMTALYIATEKENMEIIKLLISSPDIDMNSFSIVCDDHIMKTVFNLAVFKHRLDICELLLSNPKTDINVKDIYKDAISGNSERSALDIAVSHKNIEIIRFLFSQPKLVIKDYELKELIEKNSKDMQRFISANKKYSNSAENLKETEKFKETDNLLRERYINFY